MMELVPVRQAFFWGLEELARGVRLADPYRPAFGHCPGLHEALRARCPPGHTPPSPWGGSRGGPGGGPPWGGPGALGGAPGGGKNRLFPSPRSIRAHQIFGKIWPKKGGFWALIYIALYKSCGWVCVCKFTKNTNCGVLGTPRIYVMMRC